MRNKLHEIIIVLLLRLLSGVVTLFHVTGHVELCVLVFTEKRSYALVLALLSESQGLDFMIHLDSVSVLRVLLDEFLNDVEVGLYREDKLAGNSADREHSENIALLSVVEMLLQDFYCVSLLFDLL